MKKYLEFAAAAMAAIMSTTFVTGCSQSNSVKSVVSTVNTTKAENVYSGSNNTTATDTENNTTDTSHEEIATTEAGITNTTTESTVTTEAVSQLVADDRYTYYDLLNEEYEKSGAIYDIDTQNKYSIIGEDKIIVYYYDRPSIRIYDMKKKEFSPIFDLGWTGINFADVDDGYIYDSSQGGTIKYDLQGNIVNQIDVSGQIFADGTLVSRDGDVHFMYLPDWQTKIEFPELAMNASHGMKEYITNYHVIARYNNKVYAYVEYSTYNEKSGLYCLDTDESVWTKIANNKNDIGNYTFAKIIGRYMLLENTNGSGTNIYDMETDSIITTVLFYKTSPNLHYNNSESTNILYKSYCGGVGELSFSHGKLYRIKYPSDGSYGDSIIETILTTNVDADVGSTATIEDDRSVQAVNEQYYIYNDKYGKFLREYGKGEDGEIPLWINSYYANNQ